MPNMNSKRLVVIEDKAAFLAWLATTPFMTAVFESMQREAQSPSGHGHGKKPAAPKPAVDQELMDAMKSMA